MDAEKRSVAVDYYKVSNTLQKKHAILAVIILLTNGVL